MHQLHPPIIVVWLVCEEMAACRFLVVCVFAIACVLVWRGPAAVLAVNPGFRLAITDKGLNHGTSYKLADSLYAVLIAMTAIV